MSATVQPAGIADVPAMLEVMAAAFDPRFGEAWSGSQLGGTLSLPASWARLAATDGAVAGFTLCRQIAREAELLLIAVTATARRSGIGTKLLDAALNDSRQRGVETVYLEVRAGNVAAERLYHRAGFIVVGRRRAYYTGAHGELFDALTMRLDLLC